LQLVLNEFFIKLDLVFQTATNSALTQSRKKILVTAFIELSRGIVDIFYNDDEYLTYRGHRLLSVDGSKIILPNEPEIMDHFGGSTIRNQYEKVSGDYAYGLCSVCYDVLNNLVLDSLLGPQKSYEVDLLVDHLDDVKPGDVLVFDRGYTSYLLLATFLNRGIEFVGRCHNSLFKPSQEMFRKAIPSKTVTIRPHKDKRSLIKRLGLPPEITVRFVRVVLDTGEVEVLVTSLLDERRYPHEDFKEVYHLRWGIETFYCIIKERLRLENFTGTTIESVKQDFYSTIFLCNLETIVTDEAQERLKQRSKDNKYSQKVNKAVSFNALKNHVIDLLLTEDDLDYLLMKLTHLFQFNPTLERKARVCARKNSSARLKVNFLKRKRKECY
jgi:hypothetical protein